MLERWYFPYICLCFQANILNKILRTELTKLTDNAFHSVSGLLLPVYRYAYLRNDLPDHNIEVVK